MSEPTRAQAEAARWLRAAADDLRWARHARAGGFYPPACFYAHQAAEKAVKAVHYAGGARVVIGHAVRALIDSLDPPIAALARLRDDAATLDLYYIPTRYPNGLTAGVPADAFTEAQAEAAIEAAQRILDAAAAAVSGPAGAAPEDAT